MSPLQLPPPGTHPGRRTVASPHEATPTCGGENTGCSGGSLLMSHANSSFSNLFDSTFLHPVFCERSDILPTALSDGNPRYGGRCYHRRPRHASPARGRRSSGQQGQWPAIGRPGAPYCECADATSPPPAGIHNRLERGPVVGCDSDAGRSRPRHLSHRTFPHAILRSPDPRPGGI